jgi:hypothetical protein
MGLEAQDRKDMTVGIVQFNTLALAEAEQVVLAQIQ